MNRGCTGRRSERTGKNGVIRAGEGWLGEGVDVVVRAGPPKPC